MQFEKSIDFARQLDEQDALNYFRSQFHLPVDKVGHELIYLCGNSLGLQPKTVRGQIKQELEDWARLGVKGHTEATNAWVSYHHRSKAALARLLGAEMDEVVAMNTLTTNLHLLMVSFYRPQGNRYKIMVEGDLFPSDHYAVESRLKLHGYEPASGIIELKARRGEYALRTEDILSEIEKHSDEIALVLLGGVNYYTGQYFDIPAITGAAQKAGAVAGWDLAHAIGNVPMKLHEWNVDFATWCSYKYLNSGPGGVSGIFVHERHCKNPDIPRFAGWWGYDENTRFNMQKGFVPIPAADGWQLSNAPVLPLAAHQAALEIFEEADIEKLRQKSIQLTAYMEFLLSQLQENPASKDSQFNIITPADRQQRGCQLSILTGGNGRQIFEYLTSQGVVADWRNPNVIRVAPVPLYNTYTDVYWFAKHFAAAIQSVS